MKWPILFVLIITISCSNKDNELYERHLLMDATKKITNYNRIFENHVYEKAAFFSRTNWDDTVRIDMITAVDLIHDHKIKQAREVFAKIATENSLEEFDRLSKVFEYGLLKSNASSTKSDSLSILLGKEILIEHVTSHYARRTTIDSPWRFGKPSFNFAASYDSTSSLFRIIYMPMFNEFNDIGQVSILDYKNFNDPDTLKYHESIIGTAKLLEFVAPPTEYYRPIYITKRFAMGDSLVIPLMMDLTGFVQYQYDWELKHDPKFNSFERREMLSRIEGTIRSTLYGISTD